MPDFIYNIGTTMLNGDILMLIFFFVNKIIFPEREAKKYRAIPHNSKCRYGERGAAAAGAVFKPLGGNCAVLP